MKVKYLGASQDQVNWGNNDDPRPFLTVGETYEVNSRKVHTWHTKFELTEFPGKWFNSVSFEETRKP